MRNLARVVITSVSLLLLAGCAGTKGNAPVATMNTKCVCSGKPVDPKAPTADYQGGKVGFCCDQCPAKWNAMSDADKKAALAKAK
jgi:hypothetical protein